MFKISSDDAANDFNTYRKIADGSNSEHPSPVMVTHDNEPCVVILTASEFHRLKRRDKVVSATENLPEWLIEHIATTKMDPKFDYLNEGLDLSEFHPPQGRR